MFSEIKLKSCIVALFSSAFLAFGLYHIHSFSGITEGGVLGMTLLLEHWLNISPAVSGAVMNLACYVMGAKLLGRNFIIYSLVSTVGFSASYAVYEQFAPLWPQLADMPLLAAVLGAVFVGIGAGLCVYIGGATGGDDALAMSISHLTHWDIEWAYLLCDLVVLGLSISYIPPNKLACSLLTVIISGQIVGLIQKIGVRQEASEP